MNAEVGALYIALGMVAGTYGALIGVGGGLFIVPVLIAMHTAPKDAAGTSMAVVLANGISGSITYLRQRRVDVRAGIIFAASGLPGALLGAAIDQYIPHRLFSGLFGVFLLIAGVRQIAMRPIDATGAAQAADVQTTAGFAPWLAALIGFATGVIASVFGVGGGIIFVPSMAYLFGFPAHVATATSTFIIALTAIAATASHAAYGDVLWGPAVMLAAGAIVGAQIGANLSARLHSTQLLRLFALALLVAAAWLLHKAFS